MKRSVGYEREWAPLPFSECNAPECRRAETDAPSSVLFSVPNLLSNEECIAVVQAAAPHQQSVDWEYVEEVLAQEHNRFGPRTTCRVVRHLPPRPETVRSSDSRRLLVHYRLRIMATLVSQLICGC